MKKILLSILVLSFCLCLLKPSEEKFIHYLNEKCPQNDSTIKPTVQEELLISKQIDKGLLDYNIMNKIVYKYDNYFLVSYGTYVNDRDEKYEEIRTSYIGILGFFIPCNKSYKAKSM